MAPLNVSYGGGNEGTAGGGGAGGTSSGAGTAPSGAGGCSATVYDELEY